MTTTVRIWLLSKSYELKQLVVDAVNSKYVMSYTIEDQRITMTLDNDNVPREAIIECIPEHLFEWIDEIEVNPVEHKKAIITDNPFVTADRL